MRFDLTDRSDGSDRRLDQTSAPHPAIDTNSSKRSLFVVFQLRQRCPSTRPNGAPCVIAADAEARKLNVQSQQRMVTDLGLDYPGRGIMTRGLRELASWRNPWTAGVVKTVEPRSFNLERGLAGARH